MVSLCIQITDFKFDCKCYDQTEGMRIGSSQPLSQAQANLYRFKFVEKALATARKLLRYGRAWVSFTFQL